METWEYLSATRFDNGTWNCDDLEISHALNGKDVGSALNILGKQGWELAHLMPLSPVALIMKRPGPVVS